MTKAILDKATPALLWAFIGTLQLQAAVAPHSKEEMEKGATVVVEGEVLSVTSKTQKSEVERGLVMARDRVYTVTLRVSKVAKGKAKVGDELQFKAWRPSTRVPPLPGPQGHHPIPGKGDMVKVYLLGEKENSQPYMPNGIEILKEAPKGK